ncbi:MAG: hypothetical protein U0807_15665 [Candidatus Binatia bacterium]
MGGSFDVAARGSVAVTASLTDNGGTVGGTLALSADDVGLRGQYSVTGRVRGTKAKLSGVNASGVHLKWSGRASGDAFSGRAKLKGPGTKAKGLLSLSPHVVDPQPPCDSSFFDVQVMERVLKPICASCHVAGGSAAQQGARLTVSPTDAAATQTSVNALVDKTNASQSRLLLKPLGQLNHGGGAQLAQNSDEYALLAQWADLVAAGQQCSGGGGGAVNLVPLSASDLSVRASMDLRGIRPSPADMDRLEANSAEYGALLDAFLHSPEFLERVKDVYDDALLVRREDDRDEARDETSSIYGEALELIAYIVANDRPFTELGTADYTVANDLLQRDTTRMPYPMEPVTGSAWQPTHYTDGRPHAGLLSTSAFYEVWTTNDTNKNRRRANRWSIVFHCYNFLDTVVDVTRNVDNNDPNAVLNAVTTRADCKACHDRLDPMASFLFKMDDAGLEDAGPTDFFRGNGERWRSANRRPPAVDGVPGTDIRDMGRLLVQSPKFAQCQAKRVFKMLFLRDPKTNDELTAANDVAQKWASEDGYVFRRLVKRWMTSPVYTGRPSTDDPEWVRRTSPERLEALVKDLTGFVWVRQPEDNEDDNDPNSDPPRTEPLPLLTEEKDGFKIILGGLNGVNVSARSFSLNASVAMVQRKLAALAADHVVQTDLSLPDDQRTLLKGITGSEDPAVDEATIRNEIVWLIRRMYGERVAPDTSTVDVWVDLYRNLWADTSQGGTGSNQVPGTRGERAWRGLLTAMLRSPHMLLY